MEKFLMYTFMLRNFWWVAKQNNTHKNIWGDNILPRSATLQKIRWQCVCLLISNREVRIILRLIKDDDFEDKNSLGERDLCFLFFRILISWLVFAICNSFRPRRKGFQASGHSKGHSCRESPPKTSEITDSGAYDYAQASSTGWRHFID